MNLYVSSWNKTSDVLSKGGDKFNMKNIPPPEIKPAISCFPACRSNHSAIRTIIDMIFKLLH